MHIRPILVIQQRGSERFHTDYRRYSSEFKQIQSTQIPKASSQKDPPQSGLPRSSGGHHLVVEETKHLILHADQGGRNDAIELAEEVHNEADRLGEDSRLGCISAQL